MKVSRSLPAGLALACCLLGPSFGQIRVVQEPEIGPDTLKVRNFDASREQRELIEAMVVLRKHGYHDEARRLLEIVGEIPSKSKPGPGSSSGDIEARAGKLLEQDIQDREVRVAMLGVIADGYALAGDEANADAMRWFAHVGRSQAQGGTDRPMPQSILEGGGNPMDRLTSIVLGCASVQLELGNDRAAQMCGRLGRFYIERDALRNVSTEPAEEPVPTDMTDAPHATEGRGAAVQRLRAIGYAGEDPHANDLTYIEGRVPVLGLAAKAYTMKGGDLDAEEREEGQKWMKWMYNSGRRQRLGQLDVAVPDLPGPISMDALIEHIAGAGSIWEANGRPKEARRCRDLATYYDKRRKGEAVDNSARAPSGLARLVEPQGDTEEEPEEEIAEEIAEEPYEQIRTDIDLRRRALELEMKELEAQITKLQESLDRQRRGGGR